jgi:hypothetical protein
MGIGETDGTEGTEGQAADGSLETTGTESQGTEGQSTEQTTQTGTGTTDAYYDPAEFNRLTEALPDELKEQAKALQKSLQGNYTKKTQALAENQKKIDAYNAIMANPTAAIKQYAAQYGLTVSEAAAQQANIDPNDPQDWNTVYSTAEERALKKFEEKYGHVFNELQTLKKESIEKTLTELDPAWHQYEDAMLANMQKHPTLAQDAATLYRMSVPPEVLESRATQAALRKLENKGRSANIAGSSTTTKKPGGVDPNAKPSFQEAVALAKQQIKSKGGSLPPGV